MKSVIVAGLSLVACASAARVEEGTQANPIRRVVQMLQKMEAKVTAEGEKQEKMFKKYMCYCETSGSALEKSIAEAEERLPQILAEIKEKESERTQLESDLKQHKKDREEAKGSIESATAKREKEASEFAAESGELKSNIDALSRAIPAIEQGMAGSFLQSAAGRRVSKLLKSQAGASRFDLEQVTAFLQAGSGYSPASGEIVGMLKQMQERMEKDLAELTQEEKESISVFEGLVAAKQKEIAAATAAIESKTQRAGEVAVAIANLKHDNADTIENLEDDKKFLADLKTGCADQEKNWEQIEKTRQDELVAIAETIRILNSDDALELFKKTLPAPGQSFLQVGVSSKAAKSRALELLAAAAKKHPGTSLNFIMLSLRGKKVGFEKVLKMIDEMVELLKKEGKDDEAQKEWCEKEIDQNEDSIKELTHQVTNLATKIEETTEAVKTVAGEIQSLEDGIKALDKMVAEATEQRKEEHADFVEELANQNAALEILDFAKNRLNKFYNPAMYKAPQTPVPTEEQRQYFAATGEVPPELTPAPQIIPVALVAIKEHSDRAAPPPPPSAVPAYKKAGSQSNGVVGMIDRIMNDAKLEIKEMETEEKHAQADYEKTMADAAKKRADDSTTITDKQNAKADLEEQLANAKDSHKATSQELENTKQYLSKVHADCDWLLENFDLRVQARSDEIDALGKAKAVLSGASYSFVQTGAFLGKRA